MPKSNLENFKKEFDQIMKKYKMVALPQIHFPKKVTFLGKIALKILKIYKVEMGIIFKEIK